MGAAPSPPAPAPPTLAPPTPAPPTPARSFAYTLNNDPLTWQEAEDACVAGGGHLASISNQEENDEIAILCGTSSCPTGCHNEGTNYPNMCWIGGRKPDDDLSSGALAWTDGTPVGFINYDVHLSGQAVGVPSQAVLGMWNPESRHTSKESGKWQFERTVDKYVSICAKASQTQRIISAMCGDGVCVARKNDGTAVFWGNQDYGGDASNVDLTNVADAMCGGHACVARKNDGTAVAWGYQWHGGDASNVDLTNVADAMCGGRACVARKNDGAAVAWGSQTYGGDVSNVDLTNVADAMCGELACVARKNDGTAVAWGDQGYGGDASNVDLTNVADLEAIGR